MHIDATIRIIEFIEVPNKTIAQKPVPVFYLFFEKYLGGIKGADPP